MSLEFKTNITYDLDVANGIDVVIRLNISTDTYAELARFHTYIVKNRVIEFHNMLLDDKDCNLIIDDQADEYNTIVFNYTKDDKSLIINSIDKYYHISFFKLSLKNNKNLDVLLDFLKLLIYLETQLY